MALSHLKKMDELYDFTSSRNSEIKFRWNVHFLLEEQESEKKIRPELIDDFVEILSKN